MKKTTMINRLEKLFNDNRKPGNQASFVVQKADEEATVYVYDAIGDWYGDVTAKAFAKEIGGLDKGVKTLHLRINSPGGDVFEAQAIQTIIKQCGRKTIAHIDGVCASAATGIALACDEVEMADGGFFMIHKAWSLVIGNSDDMLEMAALLDKVDGSIASVYAKKTGSDQEAIKSMMAAETWFTAAEALEGGFVDRIFDGVEVEDCWNLSAYENVPKNLIEKNKKMLAQKEEAGYDKEIYERRSRLFDMRR